MFKEELLADFNFVLTGTYNGMTEDIKKGSSLDKCLFPGLEHSTFVLRSKSVNH